MTIMRAKILVEVSFRVDEDGSVRSPSISVPGREPLRDLVEAQVPLDERKAAYAEATRSRMNENMVRVRAGTFAGEVISYFKVEKLNKAHVYLGSSKYSLATGTVSGSGYYSGAGIDKDDLAELRKRAGYVSRRGGR